MNSLVTLVGETITVVYPGHVHTLNKAVLHAVFCKPHQEQLFECPGQLAGLVMLPSF